MIKKRILICDDDEEQYRTLETILAKYYDVRHCLHYKRLKQALSENAPIQLVILDLHYHGDQEQYGGYQILPDIIKDNPNLKIVVFSKILSEPKHRHEALDIARDLIRHKQVVAFLSSADQPPKVEFEIGKAMGGVQWLHDEQLNMLHLSDLQFGGSGLPGDAKTLASHVGEALLTFVETDTFKEEDRKRRFPELVVITGDLTQNGRPAEFEEAKDFVSEISAIVRNQTTELTGLLKSQNVILIPGNHDVNWDILRARSLFLTSTGVEYQNALNEKPELSFLWRYGWNPYCNAVEKLEAGTGEWAWDPGYLLLDLQKEIGVIFVLVNSSRWGIDHLTQKGIVPQSVWTKIQETLRALDSSKTATRVLLIHHSLASNVNKENRLLLAEAEDESDQLIDLLSKSCGFSIVMTGHIHDFAAHPIPTSNVKRSLFHIGAGTARSSDTKLYRNPQFSVIRLCDIHPNTNKFRNLDVYPFHWDGKRFCAYSAFGDGGKSWQRFDLDK